MAKYYLTYRELHLLKYLRTHKQATSTQMREILPSWSNLKHRGLILESHYSTSNSRKLYALSEDGKKAIDNHINKDSFAHATDVILDFLKDGQTHSSSYIVKYTGVGWGDLLNAHRAKLVRRDEDKKPYTYWIPGKEKKQNRNKERLNSHMPETFSSGEYLVLERLVLSDAFATQLNELLVYLHKPNDVIKRLESNKMIYRISPSKYRITSEGIIEFERLDDLLKNDNYIAFIMRKLGDDCNGMTLDKLASLFSEYADTETYKTEIEKTMYSRLQRLINMRRVCKNDNTNPNIYKLTYKGLSIVNNNINTKKEENKDMNNEKLKRATVEEVKRCMDILKGFGYEDGFINGIVYEALDSEVVCAREKKKTEERKKKQESMEKLSKLINDSTRQLEIMKEQYTELQKSIEE